jgi:hypothetical protein
MKKSLLLAATVAGIFGFAAGAHAGDPLLSPKAKALQDSLRAVPGTTPDLIDRSVKAGSPKALDSAQAQRKVPGTTPDMLVRNGPAAPPRLLANEPWRIQHVQIAPLK